MSDKSVAERVRRALNGSGEHLRISGSAATLASIDTAVRAVAGAETAVADATPYPWAPLPVMNTWRHVVMQLAAGRPDGPTALLLMRWQELAGSPAALGAQALSALREEAGQGPVLVVLHDAERLERPTAELLAAVGAPNGLPLAVVELSNRAVERSGPGPALTARQRVVADLLSRGMSNAEIADALGLSQNTVERHCTSIYGRLGVRCRAQVVTLLGTPRPSSHLHT